MAISLNNANGSTPATDLPPMLDINEALKQAEAENRITDTPTATDNDNAADPRRDTQQGGDFDALDTSEALDSLVKAADRKEQTPRPASGIKFPRFLTAAEFCGDHTGIDYLIKRHVPRHTLTMVFGQPSCGKTFYILDQALSVAAGLPDWHGQRVKQGSVLYLTGEGRTGLKQRITAWAEQKRIDLETIPEFRCEYAPFNLNDPGHVAALIEWINEQQIKPDWIILDTLFQFMNGDENKAEDAHAVTEGCNTIMTALNCTLTLVHHQGVSQEAKEQKRARGSSAFLGALDVVTLIERTEGGLTAEQTKNKDDSTAYMTFYTDKVELSDWKDEDGDPITSLVLRTAKEAAEDGTRPVSKHDKPAMYAFNKCAESGKGELSPAGNFYGVLHTVWKEAFCDPRINTEITGSAAKKAERFENSINTLLRNGNIEIVNAGQIKGDEDRDKRIYITKDKYAHLNFDKWAKAAQERNNKAADESPAEGEIPVY